MRKNIYKIMTLLPFGKMLLQLTGNVEVVFCSPWLDEGVDDRITVFMKKHPDTVITHNLLKELLKN